MHQLAGERVTGRPEETYKNGAMLRGTEMEAEARAFYEITSKCTIKQVGFCLAAGYGASPDGLIEEDGTLEIKCPMLATHVSYLIDGRMPTEYFQQVQGGLLVTGRKWCDFISYYPGMRPLVVRVLPDMAFLKALKIELGLFCDQLDDMVKQIRVESSLFCDEPKELVAQIK